MYRLHIGAVALAALIGGLVLVLSADRGMAQDTTKLKGTLPKDWGKLGLSDEQKQQIYKAQAKYKPKIEELQVQIDKLKNDEKVELYKVLTDAQKKELDKIRSSDPEKDKGDKDKTKDKPEKDK